MQERSRKWIEMGAKFLGTDGEDTVLVKEDAD